MGYSSQRRKKERGKNLTIKFSFYTLETPFANPPLPLPSPLPTCQDAKKEEIKRGEKKKQKKRNRKKGEKQEKKRKRKKKEKKRKGEKAKKAKKEGKNNQQSIKKINTHTSQRRHSPYWVLRLVASVQSCEMAAQKGGICIGEDGAAGSGHEGEEEMDVVHR